jgi:hypothetical protein
MKINPYFYKFSLILLLIGSLFFTSVTSAQAAATGQQMKVSACGAVQVVIKGKNPAGASVTYTLKKAATACGLISIPGMWVGSVSAAAYYYVTSEYPLYPGQTVSAVMPATRENSSSTSVTIAPPSQRQWIIWRAQTWVIDNVAYNQSSTHDGYRQDCSGYVSFAWQLNNKPGTSPSGISAYANQIPFDSLLPGDILNNPSAHTMLFVKWVDQSAGTFIAYEEEYVGVGTRERTLTLNKSTGVISQGKFYTYDGTYMAMRLKGL